MESASPSATARQTAGESASRGKLSEVPTLVAQLQSGSADAKAEAAAALWSLSVNADNKVAIAKEEGALAALVALEREGSAVGKKNAATAVKSLSGCNSNKVRGDVHRDVYSPGYCGIDCGSSAGLWGGVAGLGLL